MTPTDSQAARLHEDFVPCQCRNQSPDMEIRIQRCHGPSGVSGDLYCVYCQWCGRAVPFMSYSYGHIADVNAEAIAAWNTRPREDSGVVDEWRPIETAPRDGSNVIVFEPFSDPVVAFFSQMNRKWLGPRDSYGDAEVMQPTHWRPLPQPPALAAALGNSNG